MLERLQTERPEICFETLVRLTTVLQRQLPEPPGFDRKRTARTYWLDYLESELGDASGELADIRRRC
jgi:hypothetical protein